MGTHARLSASKTKEWGYAPGIIALHERFPLHDPSGEAAQMGTCVHDLIERCLQKGEEPAEYLGRIAVIVNPGTDKEGVSITPAGKKAPKAPDAVWFELDQELVDAATCMTDYVRNRLDAVLETKMTSSEAIEAGALYLEHRTNPLPKRDDTGGTADVTIAFIDEDFGEIELADYKNGTGVLVSVENNKQLLSYLLGRVLDLLGRIDDDYTYRMSICQPRHHLTPDDGIMSVVVTAQELREFEDWLNDAARRVDRGREIVENLFKTANDVTLEDCINALDAEGLLEVKDFGGDTIWDPYLKMSPAIERQTQETAQMDFDDDPPDEIAVPELPEHIARLLRWAPTLEKQIKDARKKANQILMEGGTVPGYKLVRKQGNRQWNDTILETDKSVKEVAEEIAKKYGVDASKLTNPPGPTTLRTGPQVLSIIPKARKADFEKDYISRPKGDLAMVDDSDKRSAVNPLNEAANAGDDFDDDL